MADEKTPEGLASIVIVYRVFGIFKEEAKKAMIEIAKRKDTGDQFDYDEFINRKIKEIPKTENNSEIINFLSGLSSTGKLY